MTTFGNLKRLNLREIWCNEAKDFTPWLASHISELGEALGMDLELTQSEAAVGGFSLDLLAVDISSHSTVVIENQLQSTDHDHLGKLITYASGFDASVIIWVSDSFREEHRKALDWLNQVTDSETEFFAVVVEILQIDDSQPAFNFRPVVFPNEWSKGGHGPTPPPTPRMEKYRNYFQALIDELRDKHAFTKSRKAQPESWHDFSSGHTGVVYGMSFVHDRKARVHLYIDLGNYDSNKALFDMFLADREAIESEFGYPLAWERLEDKRASRIGIYRPGSIEDSEPQLREIRAWSIENLLRFREVFAERTKEYLRELRSA